MAATDWPRRYLATSCLIVVLAGCSTLTSFSGSLEQVDEAMGEHRYAAALAAIDNADPRDPHYQQLRAQRAKVIAASRDYGQKALREARRLADQEQWQQAYALLEDTAPRVVTNPPILRLEKQIKEREAETLRKRLTHWYLTVGQALVNSGPVDQKLASFTDPEAGQAIAEWNRLRNRATVTLTDLGQSYADQGQWGSALPALEMAQRLSPQRPQPAVLVKARHTISNARDQEQSARNAALHKEALELVEHYEESESLDDLLAARTFLAQHSDPDLKPLKKSVDQWCQQRLLDAMERGEALYVRGEYREAHRLWKEVAPLDPDNDELNKKLERSRKVLKNLRTLDE